MLTSKDRSKLKSLASQLNPRVIVGLDGLTENVMKEIIVALDNDELVKVTILQNNDATPRDLLLIVCAKTGAEEVQVIGRKFVLYRKSKKKGVKHIEF